MSAPRVSGQTACLARPAAGGQLLTAPFVCAIGALLAGYLSRTLVDPVLPLQIARLGGSSATVGAVVGVMGMGRLLGRLVAAREADRLGRRAVITASYVLRVLVGLMYSVAPGVAALYPLRVIDSSSSSSLDSSATTLVAEMVPRARQGAALAVVGAAFIVATACGAAAAEGLMRASGLTAVFLASSLCGLAGAALMRTLRETHEPEASLTWKHSGTRLYAALTMPAIALPAASFFLVNMLYSALVIFIPPFAVSRGLLFFPFFVAYSGVALAIRLLAGGVADTVPRWKVLLPSLSVLIAASTVIGRVRTTAMLAGVGCAYGLGYGLLYPLLIAAVARRAPDALRAAGLSVFGVALDLGSAAGVAVAGQLIQFAGYAAAFTAGGLLQIAAIALVVADHAIHVDRRAGAKEAT